MAKSTTTATVTSGDISAVSNTPSSTSSSSSPTVQFLTHLTLPSKPPDLNHNNNFELHETDIFWSSSSETPSPENVSTSPPVHRQFNSGLYTALVRRKPNINPSQFAAIAARTIPMVVVKRSSEHYHQSAPVNVPNWPKNETSGCIGQFDIDKMTDEDEGEMIPPHEIVSRSYVTFSVFEGAGRTLKGRDLCSVRNAVFQKTGFID